MPGKKKGNKGKKNGQEQEVAESGANSPEQTSTPVKGSNSGVSSSTPGSVQGSPKTPAGGANSPSQPAESPIAGSPGDNASRGAAKVDNKALFYFYCRSGALDKIKEMVAKHDTLDVNESTRGCTPLHRASAFNHVDVAEYLLSLGADVDSLDTNERTPLFEAVSNGNVEMARFLLENKADHGHFNRAGVTVQHMAATTGNVEMMQLLVDAQADINVGDAIVGAAPLHYAAEKGHLDVVELLLASGADIDMQRKYSGATPLMMAAEHGHAHVVQCLLEAGAKVFMQNSLKRTALIRAAANGHHEVCKVLVEHMSEAEVEHFDKTGMNALFAACDTGNAATVEVLIQSGLNPLAKPEDMYGNQGKTALHFCASERPSPMDESVTSEQFDLANENWQSDGPEKIGALFSSAKHESPSINARDRHNNTPLHAAAQAGDERTVAELLERGAMANAQNDHHQTAFHLAVKHNRLEVVQTMLQKKVWPQSSEAEEESNAPLAIVDKTLEDKAQKKNVLLQKRAQEIRHLLINDICVNDQPDTSMNNTTLNVSDMSSDSSASGDGSVAGGKGKKSGKGAGFGTFLLTAVVVGAGAFAWTHREELKERFE